MSGGRGGWWWVGGGCGGVCKRGTYDPCVLKWTMDDMWASDADERM